MTRTRALVVLWLVLALLTIYLTVNSDLPRFVIALSAWSGGIVTQQMYRAYRDSRPDRLITRTRPS